MIELRSSKIHGRGVFATQNLPKGYEFEFPILAFDRYSKTLPDYHFPWSRKQSCLVMGLGSFFNHQDKPNCKIYKIDKELNTKTFIVIQDILKDEEITIKYGTNKFE